MNETTLLVVEPDEHYVEAVAKRAVADGLAGAFAIVKNDPESFADAAKSAGRGRMIIAKGMLETADFLRLILKYNGKELITGGDGGFLSHCTILAKGGSRPLILTDAAINIEPDAGTKAKIVKNAIDLARALFGVRRPVVSILTPAGKLNDKIKSSVDGDFAIRQLAGEDAEIRLDQMDTAIDAGARAMKKLGGGVADILLADNLDVGNAIYKLYAKVGGYDAAGIVCGAAVPTVLNSRADNAASKLLSIKYAARLTVPGSPPREAPPERDKR
jgi:phosphate butyryltransferase